MRTLNGLHIEIIHTIGRADSCVARVGKGARLAATEAGDIVLIAAKGLGLLRSGQQCNGQHIYLKVKDTSSGGDMSEWSTYFSLYEQNLWAITSQITSSDAIVLSDALDFGIFVGLPRFNCCAKIVNFLE